MFMFMFYGSTINISFYFRKPSYPWLKGLKIKLPDEIEMCLDKTKSVDAVNKENFMPDLKK